MKKCVVIGGGFAGLSSAVFLSQAGFKVEVLEASQKLGGRAYSFKDKETQTIIDNGQHILMGCYKETLKFLRLIGAEKNFSFQERLKVNFLNDRGRLFRLEATQLFYPLNLLFGLLNFEALSFVNRLMLLKFFIKLYFYSDEELKRLTIHQWLLLEGQNEEIRKAFWDFLAIGALNTNTKKASAKVFADILKEIFFKGNNAATIILPVKGLTKSFCNDAQSFIERKGGTINLSEQVLNFEIADNKATKVITSKRTMTDFDYVISSVPWFALEKFYKDEDLNLNFEHSSILTFHVWLKDVHSELVSEFHSVKNMLKQVQHDASQDFYGLIGSPIHWIFDHGTHLTLVKSDANDLIEKSNEELFEMAVAELEKFAKIDIDSITSFKIIKEKRSTFIPSNEILDRRPSSKTKYKNFFLAGDWIDTGLPSTIESAVKSGRMAAKEILKMENV